MLDMLTALGTIITLIVLASLERARYIASLNDEI
jgi:hypothetical protein